MLRRYHELVGKILGVAVKDKGISVKDLVVPILQTASKEYPAGSVQFGPSIPQTLLGNALEFGFEQIQRKDEFLAAGPIKNGSSKPRKIPKPKKWTGEGECDFTGLSDSPDL